jgi:glycosyltransferase involved in cell wall biosynthesis
MLKSHLGALAAQTYPRQSTEWIIVCDGCIDDSAQVARDAGADQVIEQAGSGPAAARNAGLAAAHAPIVLFLDDDIIPTPGWVQALVDDFGSNDTKLLHMGYCPHAPTGIVTHLDRRNAAWYEGKIATLSQPGYRLRFTDFFGGNFAVDRAEFRLLGGFDTSFWLAEDFEMAFRALRSGWQIRFVPAARAEHHAHRDAHAYGDQAFRAGQADAMFVRVHPQVAPHVRIGIKRRPLKRLAGAAWRGLSLRSAAGVGLAERLAPIAERVKARALLDVLYPLLWDGQYWRGVKAT